MKKLSWRIATSSGVMLGFLLSSAVWLGGCNPGTTDPVEKTPAVETVEKAEVPPAADMEASTEMTAPDAAPTAEVNAEKLLADRDLFGLYAMLQDKAADPQKLEAVEQSYNKLLSEILEQDPIVNLQNEGKDFGGFVELYAFDLKYIDDSTARAYWLFKVKNKLDENRSVVLCGFLDASHEKYLSEAAKSRAKDGVPGFESWHVFPEPDATTWEPGQTVVVSLDVPAAPVPYNFETGLYTTQGGGAGYRVPLGWHVALSE